MRETPKAFVAAFNKHKSIKGVCRNEGITYWLGRKLYAQAVEQGLMPPLPVGAKSADQLKEAPKIVPTGHVYAMQSKKLPLPTQGHRKYLFTCAQNDTLIHTQLWDNIMSYMAWNELAGVECQLHVSRLTYVKRGLGAAGDKAQILKRETLYGGQDMTWPPQIVPFLSDERLQIAPGLVWCGESNILPTAINPLSGFESYTGRKSGIFPHTKVALESIPSMANEGTKFNYTTGAVTLRNHIQRKAGLKADFHHCYGFLLAEVDLNGDWWCRPVVADAAGTFYDLDVRVKDGVVEEGAWIDSIVWGDVHEQILDRSVRDLCWAKDGILDTLRPKRQFIHDLLNFTGRNHHETKDPMTRFRRWLTGVESVEKEVCGAGDFLEDYAERPWCETLVVNSNHDRALTRWLKEQDARFDPVNVEFWSSMWAAVASEIRDTSEEPDCFELACKLCEYKGTAKFLPRDASYVVCEDENGGVECGMHGDEGPNGSRGNIRSYARMGRKIVVAHTHRAGIVDGVYQVGAMCALRPEYVHGPDAASHTFCLVYENGKRTLVTIWNNQYRA